MSTSSSIVLTDCPACNQRTLQVTDYKGTAILNCMAGCAPGAILTALSLLRAPDNVVEFKPRTQPDNGGFTG